MGKIAYYFKEEKHGSRPLFCQEGRNGLSAKGADAVLVRFLHLAGFRRGKGTAWDVICGDKEHNEYKKIRLQA